MHSLKLLATPCRCSGLIVPLFDISKLSGHLLTTSGVRQGCVLAPSLFCIAIYWMAWHMTSRPGITVGQQHFTDLVYADDTTFLVDSPTQASSCLSIFSDVRFAYLMAKDLNSKRRLWTTATVYSGRWNPVDSVSTCTYL